MNPDTVDLFASAIVAAATANVAVYTRHALPVIRRGRWRLAVALAAGMAGAAWLALPGGDVRPATHAQPGPTITPTLTVTATATITPTATAAPSQTPPWVSIRTDASMRVQLCTGLSKVGPTPGTLPALDGCIDVAPWGGAPPVSAPGQWYALWPGQFVYRIIPEPTPWPGWCEPVIVTATPLPTDTPTPTPTADWIATAVAGTLTALAPTPTGTPRATDTPPATLAPEATPTRAVYSLTLFPLLQHRPPTARRR